MSKLRLLLIALFAIVSSTVFGVNIRISDTGDVGNTFQIDCDASASEQTTTTFFYDSGLTGNYSANESYIRDLASTNGGALSIKFVEFNLATGTVMTIKDAISQAVLVSNATGTQLNGRTFTSNRGALQIIWSSSTSVGSGFKAKVWCGSRCQAFQTTINVAGITPTVDNGVQYFDICSGTGVNFSAQNTFNVPVGDPQHEYDQTDANLTYHWYYIDGGNDTTRLTGSSQNISINFAEGGGYYVVCDAEDTQGCLNRNVNKRQVRVSMRPDFRGTTFTPDTICPGSPVTFSGRVNAHPWSMEIPEIVAGATFLPDGNSTCYSTSLVFDIFADGATITSRDQIERLYLNLEHSYFGDLSILLECPSGQRCLIHAHGTGTMASLNWSLSNAGYQVQGS
ncbi:MAG: proprotein convertase P-domain-containing protein, partial [Bacteroidales bacterium]|nr:proprotein convertase P-domain-containing protein [Bacteroidales bacterium]